MRSIDYTAEAWKHYSKPSKLTDGIKTWEIPSRAKIIYEADEPSMIHIDEPLRTGFITPFTQYIGAPTDEYNEILDWTPDQRILNNE